MNFEGSISMACISFLKFEICWKLTSLKTGSCNKFYMLLVFWTNKNMHCQCSDMQNVKCVFTSFVYLAISLFMLPILTYILISWMLTSQVFGFNDVLHAYLIFLFTSRMWSSKTCHYYFLVQVESLNWHGNMDRCNTL